ncbi:MAG TPA: ATP-binding domain-containing protein, partial [Paenisporosarcina sp.]|nr:ATP-binding domain-containing protein [Paenisporosarcina sp.]
IYRQSAGSSIIELAHQMKKGQLPPNITAKTADRSFIQAGPEQIAKVVEQVIKSALAKGHTIKELQVLAPMYKGPAGIDALNKMIQQMVNPNDTKKRKELVFGETIYRIGDKVLQLVNQPESQVYNGDMGEVISISKASENIEKQDMMIVSFEGIEVTYQRNDLGQLTLAYCCSIHKSQGSEFPIVIMPVVRSYMKMLRRNLLYTGITRAKNFLILCGDADVFKFGIERNDDLARLTSLKERLSEEIVPVTEPIIEDEITNEDEGPMSLNTTNHLKIHPLVGMNGTTPYDFLEEIAK